MGHYHILIKDQIPISPRHGYPYDPSSGPAPGFPHSESYNPHRHSSHKSESYLQPPGPSGRRSSHSQRSQGPAAGGPQQQSMAIDEDEDDDDDDGEIKPDTRGRRRSNSFTSSQTQDGGANKKQAQDGDHSDVHKCMDCGKVYKHPNCLWKHRWLHSQYWKSATKFLLSKHQQVQLMEAAAILLGMDESRQGDNDPIVSMFSKQRGALANSVGSGASSSSASPPTSTKSLSGSPPPQSERQQRSNHSTSTGISRTTEVQHADIQMLTALRGGHASLKAISTSFPTPPPTAASAANNTTAATTPSTTTTSVKNAPTTNTSASSSQSSSLSSSPNHSKAGVTTSSSSSRSTPPTLTADDESVPEMDEEMPIVTPPSRGESTPIIPVVHVLEKLGGSNSVGVVGMGIGMDVDPPKHQPGSQTQSVTKQGPPHSQHEYRGGEDRYRYSGYQKQQQQQQQQPLPFHHQSHLQGPTRSHTHHQSEQHQHSRHHQQQPQQQQHRS
ncbi:hypothetical protein EC957_011179 [Mortierella hygrophila]|uniref:C2H2-type domain-containing protein n=1 Tax=Mortierella hygrophila TaxID=979708 RepID=A0A9P6K3Y0_9FUNG|nr:hypothetical protein EC957_011179 [Mortierella hygrophila]